MKTNKAAVIKFLRGDFPVHLPLTILLLLSLLPVAMFVIVGGKTAAQFVVKPWGLTLPYHFENYIRMARAMIHYIMNNVIVSVAATSLAVLLASFSSYVFARFAFPGKEMLFYAILGLMLIPSALTLVPQYVLVLKLGLTNSRWALILPYAAGGAIFGVFLLRPFMASLPNELFEAARLDGAGEWQTYFHIALPLSRSMLVTLAILLVLGQWNDVIWASVVITSERLYTVSLGAWSLASVTATFYKSQTQWGMIFAAFAIASLPMIILFIFARRYFIEGLSSGALKM